MKIKNLFYLFVLLNFNTSFCMYDPSADEDADMNMVYLDNRGEEFKKLLTNNNQHENQDLVEINEFKRKLNTVIEIIRLNDEDYNFSVAEKLGPIIVAIIRNDYKFLEKNLNSENIKQPCNSSLKWTPLMWALATNNKTLITTFIKVPISPIELRKILKIIKIFYNYPNARKMRRRIKNSNDSFMIK